MLIIAGRLYVDPESRDDFIEGHREIVELARQAPGCLDVAISPDPIEPGRVNMIEHWESEETLAYWRSVSPAPSTKVQIQQGDVRKHQISRSGPPFD